MAMHGRQCRAQQLRAPLSVAATPWRPNSGFARSTKLCPALPSSAPDSAPAMHQRFQVIPRSASWDQPQQGTPAPVAMLLSRCTASLRAPS